MADPQKGTSAASVEQKKSSSLDDEIGNDFLTSWNLTRNASDALDFNVSEIPGKGKMKFDFNKLDDFEFGGDFDKMLSFKMDMSDLDFPRPSKKSEKTNEKSGKDSLLGKKDRNSDTFSFNFDFNELEGFGLESNLLKDGKFENGNKRKCENDHEGLAYLSKRERNNDSKSNSATTSDKNCRNESRLDDTTSLNSEHLIGNQTLDVINNAVLPNASNLKCLEAVSPLSKQAIANKRNDNDGNEKKGPSEKSEIPDLVNQCYEKDNRVCFIQSKDMSLSAIHPQVEIEVHDSDSSDSKADFMPNKDANGMRSPDSRGSSSANTHGPCLSIAADKLQEHSNDQNDESSGILSKNRSNDVVKNVEYPPLSSPSPVSVTSSKLGSVMKGAGNIWKSSTKVLQSSLQRESNFDKSIGSNAKNNDVLQLKPQRAPFSFEYPQNSVSSLKTTDPVSGQKMKKSCALFVDAKRGVDKTVLIVGSSKSFSGNTTKQELLIPDSNEKQKDISDSFISRQAATLISPLSTIPKTGPSNQKIKTSPLHKPGLPFTIAGGINDKTNLRNLRQKEPSSDLNKSFEQRKSNLTRISDKIMERKSVATPMTLQADISRKFTSLSPTLKRKSFEETDATVISNPLKRLSESPTEKRQLSHSSPKLSGQVVPGIENTECFPNGASFIHQNSPVPLTFEKSMLNVTDPTLLESDENVQMAESCSKELDDICKMLKKKHEEAKELLVRVMVNNNSLLMLNHPMLDEKIS